jgi:hypothetical protein
MERGAVCGVKRVFYAEIFIQSRKDGFPTSFSFREKSDFKALAQIFPAAQTRPPPRAAGGDTKASASTGGAAWRRNPGRFDATLPPYQTFHPTGSYFFYTF